MVWLLSVPKLLQDLWAWGKVSIRSFLYFPSDAFWEGKRSQGHMIFAVSRLAFRPPEGYSS
ncbi:hypothetical protein E2C01_070805 [Portunus trituberculatus]|uniref:Uncharacterized protein n=1 Tax=Portunus trituberculatus TaxID=210409 RepID=A0A5B7I2M0_PORTR|nr:hypothetical protein [Portunus trituberculatus]